MKSFIRNKTFIASLFIIIVSLIVSIPMFNPDFNMQYDDGIQHICRLIGTEQSINEGEIIPVIMSNLCNGFGYSWNLFYSPVTSYLPLIFRIFTTSYEMCLKLFMLVVSVVTGFSMYFFMKKFLKRKDINKNNINGTTDDSAKTVLLDDNKIELIAILASILYILFPYRLNDMYSRMAIAELTSFIFLPMVLNGLYSIINLKEKSYLLIVGGAGMLLTHSLLTVYLVIFCIIYLLINIKRINKKIIFTLFANVGIILLLTAFYWVPLLQTRFSADYEVFNKDHMIRWDAMMELKVKPSELAFYIQGRMFYGLGILVIIGTVLSLFILRQKEFDRKNFIFFLICGIISTIMTLDFFPFEKLPSLFTMMQFSFRMLEFGGFFLIVCASIAIGLSLEKFNVYAKLAFTSVFVLLLMPGLLDSFRIINLGSILLIISLMIIIGLSTSKLNIYIVLGLTCISLILLLPNLYELHYGRYCTEEDLIKGIPVTSNTGRVHAGCASFEYLPSKAFENRAYIESREDVPIILSENSTSDIQDNVDTTNSIDAKSAVIENYNKNGTTCNFKVVTQERVDETELSNQKENSQMEDSNNNENSQIDDSNAIEDSLKIELPYIYYIGYNVEYTDESGNNYSVETYESENGFLCIDIPNENITVNVKYTGTVLMKIAYIISAVTVFALIIIYFIKRANKKSRNEENA